MCWNVQVSLASAAVGWATCLYLGVRQRSVRDAYYARYLLTFTFTQVADIILWMASEGSGPGGLQACKSYQFQFGSAPSSTSPSSLFGVGSAGARYAPLNFYISKYVIPLIVFSQHAMQLSYPSNAFKGKRIPLVLVHAIPCLVMSFCFGCTMLVDSVFPRQGKTLFWGGDFSDYPFWVIQIGACVHSGIVAMGFSLVGMQGRVLAAHLIPLACVVATLWITEGRMDFGSKWCSYCLIYSAVYILEPVWLPDDKKTKSA